MILSQNENTDTPPLTPPIDGKGESDGHELRQPHEPEENKGKPKNKPNFHESGTMYADDIDTRSRQSDNKDNKKGNNNSNRLFNDINGLGFIAMLFAFFLGADKKSLEKGQAVEQVADSLGLDKEKLTQTTNDVISGKTTAFSAAVSTAESIEPENIDWDKANKVKISSIIPKTSTTSSNPKNLLHPDLVIAMNNDPKIAQMVQWTFDAAAREGIDGTLLANQFWAESNFRPNVTSKAGARGIAQFMPEHLGKWGLETEADFYDPLKSINAGAKFMSHLTNKFGNQQLAMIVYNGRKDALDFVRENISEELTIGAWIKFMEKRNREYETVPELISRDKDSAWHNETLNYIKKIDSTYWNNDLLARAEQQQSPNQKMFNNGGVVVADTQQPDPLPFDGIGVDQIALAAKGDAANKATPAAPNLPKLSRG